MVYFLRTSSTVEGTQNVNFFKRGTTFEKGWEPPGVTFPWCNFNFYKIKKNDCTEVHVI